MVNKTSLTFIIVFVTILVAAFIVLLATGYYDMTNEEVIENLPATIEPDA